MNALFSQNQLPIEELKKLGLYENGQILIEPEDMQTLLSGRRTSLIALRELKGDGFIIERLDAKLSLYKNERGATQILLHPIYSDIKAHPLLSPQEIMDLVEGKLDFISKPIQQEEGRSTMFNIEYDEQTRDFVGYDVSQVQAPDLVNSILLDEQQRAAFRRGEQISLPDGTRFQHRATEPLGIRSDRKALIISVLLDGGISYLLLRGIRSIHAKGHQADYQTPAFTKALEQMQGQSRAINPHLSMASQEQVFMRGMSR